MCKKENPDISHNTGNEITCLTTKQAADILRAHDNFLLVTHARPDADTVGSSVALGEALRSIGKKVKIMCTDTIPERLSFLLNCIGNEEVSECSHEKENYLLKKNEYMSFHADFIISVDVASLSLIGDYPKELLPEINMKIDHHQQRDRFARYDITRSDYASCGEVIYEIICEICTITSDIATALYSAIVSDTGSFRFDSVTPNTHKTVASLLETGFDHSAVCRTLFSTHTLSEMRATELAIHNLNFFRNGTIAATSIELSDMLRYGIAKDDTASINSLPVGISGVELGIVLKEDTVPNRYKISLRSNEYMDTSMIAATFGGGGHIHASGCVIDAPNVEETLNLILKAIYDIYGDAVE